MIPAGERTTLVAFERGTAATDAYGGETLTFASLATVATKVLYGTGAERRQAAQESAQQTATVMVNWTPQLAGVVPKDRTVFDTFDWDIVNVARIGLNDEIHYSVVRSA